MVDLPVMQDDRVHWNGQPVAVVLAETQEQADHAATLVRVDLRRRAGQPRLRGRQGRGASRRRTSWASRPPSTMGDAEAALRGRATRSTRPTARRATTTTPSSCMRSPSRGRATAPDRARRHADAPLHRRRRSPRCSASSADQVRVQLAVRRRRLRQQDALGPPDPGDRGGEAGRRPVRLVLSREGVFRAIGGRTTTEQRVALAARADGRLDGADPHRRRGHDSRHNELARAVHLPGPPALCRRRLQARAGGGCDLDMVANTFMRAPGESVGTFALESRAGRARGRDGPGPDRAAPPHRAREGPDLGPRLLLAPPRRRPIGDGAERFGWDRRDPTPGARREGEWLVGMGVATATYPYYRMPGGAARIRLTADGRAVVQMASHEMGMGTATVQAQHAAERLGAAAGPGALRARRHGPARPARSPAARSQTAVDRGRGRRGARGAGRASC